MRKGVLFTCWLLAAVFLFSPVFAGAEIIMTDEEWIEIQEALESDEKEIEVEQNYRVMVDPNDLNLTQGLSGEWLNIMLIGTDSDFNKLLSGGSSDLTIIASVNVQTGEIKLTSLVRDMYVRIPGTNHSNRLNVTNAFGGPLLVMKTVNTEFGMNIRNYCSINFKGYTEVIDILGGVELSLSLAEAERVKAKYTTEPQILNGEQALAYSRIHTSLGNNFDAAERNKRVLMSIFQDLKSGSSIEQIFKTITVALRYIDTNLTLMDLVSLAAAVFRNPDLDIQTLSLPQEGTWQYSRTSWGLSVVDFNHDEAIAALYSFIYDQ